MTVHCGSMDFSEHLVRLLFFIFLLEGLANAGVFYGHVEENLPPETKVADLSIPVWRIWPGVPSESGLGFALEGEEASDFYLYYHQERLLLKTTKTLDREVKSAYALTARATSYVCSNKTMLLNIKVLDKNDNRPRFIQQILNVDVDEFIPVGTEILKLVAVDNDSGENARITYYASPSNAPMFVVPKTGQVMVVDSLVGETNFTFYAFAKDNGDIAIKSDPAIVQIHVKKSQVDGIVSKSRKMRAVSEEMFYAVSVAEDMNVGDLIFIVPGLKFEKKWFEVISDADSPVRIERDSGKLYLTQRLQSATDVVVKIQNLKETKYEPLGTQSLILHCSVFLSSGGEDRFEVDRITGEIRTTGLPLVPHSEYILTVQAVDRLGSKGPYASVSVLTGSRPPQFTNVSYTVFVPENTVAGHVEYVLTVQAVDRLGSKGPYASVSVLAGSRPPQFTNVSYTVFVPENTVAGHVVAVVEAISFQRLKLSYTLLINPSSLFSVNQENGELSLTRNVDYESEHHLYHLLVRALEPGAGLSTVTEVVVHISDENDCTPEFLHSIYSRDNIPENIPVGTSLLQGGEDRFEVDRITGEIRTTGLPLVPHSEYILTVQAVDRLGSKGPYASVSVLAGSRPPQFTNVSYTVFVPENTVAGHVYKTFLSEDAGSNTLVAIVHAKDPDGDAVSYAITGGNEDGNFDLDNQKGVITTALSFDREKQKEYTLSVTATDLAQEPLIGVCQITILIADENDNNPKFENSRYQYFLREDTPVGTSFLRAAAHDDDQGSNAAITYSLSLQQPEYLHINPSTGWLYVNHPISQTSRISRHIIATDGGNRSSTVGLSITITNVHNQPPQWEQGEYWVTLPENTTRDTKIVFYEGANAKLRYQITSGNVKGIFDVEPEVGTIFIAQPLNYEQEQRYELRLVASDGKWENHTLVIINVINQNDEAPIFSQSEYYDSIMEELPELPVLVLQVSATDPDQEADQSALRYSLHGQGANSEFTIEELTGNIYAQKKLDREERSVWRFLVLATDENGAGLTGFADVIVEVQDVNDNPPVFLCAVDGCFMGYIPENSPADTSIMEMTATDLDDPKAGKNAILTYRIVQNVRNEINLNLFSINPSTGTIYTVLRSLDREREDKYLVVVEARDGGGLTGTGTATILVSDINDHAPVFTQRMYTASVTENLDINSEVLVVSATDMDEGENAIMTFSIVGGDEDRKFFIETDKINKVGIIRLKKNIDFEKPQERTFNLTIKVEDMDFFSLAYFVIQVEDSNDHAPVFFPQFYEAGPIFEDVSVGTIITQVTAIDLDSGQNGKFFYSISHESDPFDQFLVDNSGWVVVADYLDREKVAQHRLMVHATDLGNPTMTGSAIVLVTVQDVNDNGPEFEVQYQPIVWENAAAPQVVKMNDTSLLLCAKDRDTAPNGSPFSFQLLSDSNTATSFNLTDLGNGSAIVTALATFDREEQKHYYLSVMMTDSGNPPMSSTSTLTITIGDRNDHLHAAGHSEFIVYSYDGTLPTTLLGQVQSPDLDDWDTKIYRSEAKPSRHFILDENSGSLSIREGTPSGTYNLQVRVTDRPWPDVVSTVKVVVKELKKEAIQNAGSIRITNMTAEEFISAEVDKESKYSMLKRVLSEIIPAQLDNIHIFSVMNASQRLREVSVWFAAHGSSYYKAEKLNGNVAAYKDKLEAVLGLSISQAGVDECVYSNCSHTGGCTSSVSFSNTPTVVNAGSVSLISISTSSSAQCTCLAREWRHLSCSSYPSNPCLNGGSCMDSDLGYRCKCSPLFDGPECQQMKHTFRGHGYAWFPPIKPCFESHISLEFITESANGLLLYNGPVAQSQPGEREDFIALELKNGVPSLSISHGSGSLQLQLPSKVRVADRRWHHIDIISNGKTVQLILDRCSGALVNEVEGLGVDVVETDQTMCKTSGETPGKERFLDVNQPLQIGGMKDSLPYRRTQLHFRGFTGCIRNLLVDSQVYDLGSPAESLNSAPGCALTDGVCQTAGGLSCGAHGKCLGEWGSFSCDCHPGYTGHKCDKAQPEWSFEKNSLIRYQQIVAGSPRRTQAQLLVRTRGHSGTLLSMASRDASEYIILEAVDGQFGVRVNLGDGNHSLRLQASRIDNGQWVLLNLDRYDNVFMLRLDHGGGARQVSATLGNKRELVINPSSVLLGNSLFENQQNDFQGCMRDVRLNGHSLPLDGRSTEFSTVLDQRGVLGGCHSDTCSSKPCYSPLYCVDLWRKHECRCPSGQVPVVDNVSGLQQCAPSPCVPLTCHNGGTCIAQSLKSFSCRCTEGYKGQRCEISQVKTGKAATLSPSSILAISMCLLVFLGILVAVTVWNQKGSSKYQKRGVYHIPAEHESWEDIRENILNYNEEGGGEQDQNAYDITELKRPLCSSLSQSSSGTTVPLLKSSQGSQEEVHPGAMPCYHQNIGSIASCHPDFKNYVSRIVWEADNDAHAVPMDSVHIYCVEGYGSPAGSLSSLESATDQEDLNYDCLKEWGSKFEKLRELYRRPEFTLTPGEKCEIEHTY
ncbi:UNVERIFIED_CONTAM: hypothetical protein FKN15_039322 [Acipenser sinensis]